VGEGVTAPMDVIEHASANKRFDKECIVSFSK
jgi:hypothetical protein